VSYRRRVWAERRENLPTWKDASVGEPSWSRVGAWGGGLERLDDRQRWILGSCHVSRRTGVSSIDGRVGRTVNSGNRRLTTEKSYEAFSVRDSFPDGLLVPEVRRGVIRVEAGHRAARSDGSITGIASADFYVVPSCHTIGDLPLLYNWGRRRFSSGFQSQRL